MKKQKYFISWWYTKATFNGRQHVQTWGFDNDILDIDDITAEKISDIEKEIKATKHLTHIKIMCLQKAG